MVPVSPKLRLEGKVLVLIGGTSGIGLSAAKAFLREGAKVVVVGKNSEKINGAMSELGSGAAAITGDATMPKTAEIAIAEAQRAFGGFHGLYHVAGGSGRQHGDGPLHELADSGWQYSIQLNLTSVMLSNRAAARALLSQGSAGSILNCGSVLSHSPSPRFFATHAYAAAKAGIVGLTQSAASHYAARQIRFNVLAPGLVATPMSERAQADPSIMRFVKTKQPLDGGRIGRPEDLDGAAVWLMSDESRFVTGQMIVVDGGWSVSEGQW